MRRRSCSLSVESVEQRLSLSGLAAGAPSVAAEVGATDRLRLNSIADSHDGLKSEAPSTSGANGIIAILIG
jgi:hypothetical protein